MSKAYGDNAPDDAMPDNTTLHVPLSMCHVAARFHFLGSVPRKPMDVNTRGFTTSMIFRA